MPESKPTTENADAPQREYDRSSRNRLNLHDLPRFEGQTLFAKLARTVCEAECLPRKELFEAWEVARRVRRRMRGGRVVDMAAGHGLLAWTMLLLDDSSPDAVCVDPDEPPSFVRLEAGLTARWPRLKGRVRYIDTDLEQVPLSSDDLVVCVHGCGPLTDRVLALACDAGARVAVLPCCHDVARSRTGRFEAWMPGPLAVDVERVHLLRERGYDVRLKTIPADITPMNRLILGWPSPDSAHDPADTRSGSELQ